MIHDCLTIWITKVDITVTYPVARENFVFYLNLQGRLLIESTGADQMTNQLPDISATEPETNTRPFLDQDRKWTEFLP